MGGCGAPTVATRFPNHELPCYCTTGKCGSTQLEHSFTVCHPIYFCYFIIIIIIQRNKQKKKKTTTKPPTPGYTMVCLCLFVFFFFVVVCLFVLKNQNKQTMASHPQQPMGGVSAKTKKFHMSPLVRFWQGFFWGHSCAREAHRADDRLRDRLWKLLVENYPITPLSSPS